MTPGVSVVICCHNSSKRLPETLRHLAAQKAPTGVDWEIIIVDNASTDNTAKTATDNWPTTAPAPLQVVAESKPGLNNARRRGILAARHDVISLIDDDNWVCVDWIARVHQAFAANPQMGALGGRSEACPEIAPPSWFDNVKGYYAVGRQHPQDGDITESLGTLLWGAGLNLRTAAFHDLLALGFEFIVHDRRGSQLSTGGDTELCFALRASGWRLWYDHALVLQHFISKDRLRWDYARRLMQGMGKAAVLFDLYLTALDRPPIKGRAPWKNTWLFHLLKFLKELVAVIALHPKDWISGREGSPAVLKYDIIKGRLTMLWSMRESYQRTAAAIAQSKWAHAANTTPGPA